MKKALLFILILTSVLPASAANKLTAMQRRMMDLHECYTDSLTRLKAELDSVRAYRDSTWYEQQMQGQYYQLFVPSTFFHSIAQQRMGYSELSQEEQQVGNALYLLYMQHPELISLTEKQLSSRSMKTEDIIIETETQGIELPQVEAVDVITPVTSDPVEVVIQKPKMWSRSGDFYLQLLQNYFSNNWYKGGESNYAMVGRITLQANYNNLWGLKWDNKLEMKLGMQNNRTDSIHKIKSSEDLLRFTSKLGKQATGRWYYMLQLIATTQFTHGYKANDRKVYSDFLAPLDLALSVGLDYKLDTKNGKLKGTVNVSPLAVNYKYVRHVDLAKSFGLDEGTRYKIDLGSQFTLDAEWQVVKDFKWKSRLYGFTSYKRALIEWENTFSFQFNKYIACNLFVYPRFDDSVKPDDEYGHWQLREYASLGFTLSL